MIRSCVLDIAALAAMKSQERWIRATGNLGFNPQEAILCKEVQR
jgi:hypothetical protein